MLRNYVWHGRFVRPYIRVCECGAVLLCGAGADGTYDIGEVLYALFRLPKAKHVAKAFMRIGIVVSALTGILLIVSAIHALSMFDMHNISQAEINAVQVSIMTPDPNPIIHDMFQKTMHWLMDSSKGNMGYNAINLLIYVLLMPVLIITSIFVCHKTSKKYYA